MLDKRSIALLRPVRWTPRRIAGLQLWLSARQEAGKRGLAPGQSVTLDTWADLSGRGNHASQATAAKRPTLLHDGARWEVRFDGVDDLMLTPDFGLAQPHTTVLAGYWRGTGVFVGDQTLLDGRFGNRALLQGVAGQTNYRIRASVTAITVGTAPRVPTVVSVRWQGAQTALWENGAQRFSGDPGSGAPLGFCLGANAAEANFGSVTVIGFLAYASALPDGARRQAERWLDREARLGLNL